MSESGPPPTADLHPTDPRHTNPGATALRPTVEVIEAGGGVVRIVDAARIASAVASTGGRVELAHDLSPAGLRLFAAPDGFTARWPRNGFSLPDFLRTFAAGAAGGALIRVLGLPGAVLGAALAIQVHRAGRGRPATDVRSDDPTVTATTDGTDLVVHGEHLAAVVLAVLHLTGRQEPVTVGPPGSDAVRSDGPRPGPGAGRIAIGRLSIGAVGIGLSGTGPGGSAPVEESGPVGLDQIGGLVEIVAQFRDVAVSFRHPEVMARWGATRPQGILLYGPPGTGKTMLARALAHEIGGDLREIRTPEILDKWVGNSEKNIQRVFAEARRLRNPTVLLFDEFDSIISYTGGGQDAAGQMINAVAGIFKQEMNTLIEHNPNVIVVATTNFPGRVDASLVRSGRFDLKLAVPLPDAAARADILTKLIRQLTTRHELGAFRMFADDLDIAELAASSAGLTGADFKEALRRAQLDKAMREARTGTPATPITQADLRESIARLRQGTS